jgi:hypothetical protein
LGKDQFWQSFFVQSLFGFGQTLLKKHKLFKRRITSCPWPWLESSSVAVSSPADTISAKLCYSSIKLKNM